jgi:hypothetical protein
MSVGCLNSCAFPWSCSAVAPRLDLGVNSHFASAEFTRSEAHHPLSASYPPKSHPAPDPRNTCTAWNQQHAHDTHPRHARHPCTNSPKIYLDCAFENRHTSLETRSSTTTTPHDQRPQYVQYMVDLCCSSISASSIRRYRKKIWNLPVRWARTRMIRIWSNDSICHSPYT